MLQKHYNKQIQLYDKKNLCCKNIYTLKNIRIIFLNNSIDQLMLRKQYKKLAAKSKTCFDSKLK